MHKAICIQFNIYQFGIIIDCIGILLYKLLTN